MIAAPKELALADVFFPPLLLVMVIAYLATLATSYGLVKSGLQRFVAMPALFELSLTAIYAVLLATYVIPS
ncbi:DUF1656 domain-containing protein [Ferrimonas marina]|uniref:DUF1656 domain-containing protein n=1 Tax=Ferrimonas marina TaxID=299255 RepID=A0A1M5R4M7_9GAMM|nr:DUF1656 domain-containing protein [Ferrimonas marina]SHH21345.1 Protein of unknown function [Ferrimonas marina]